MPKLFQILMLCSLLFCSCTKSKIDAPDPIKELIAKTENCTCDPYIDEYTWRDKTVYLSSCGGPACDCITLYYDAAGYKIIMPADYTPDAFQQEAQFVKHTWRCGN